MIVAVAFYAVFVLEYGTGKRRLFRFPDALLAVVGYCLCRGSFIAPEDRSRAQCLRLWSLPWVISVFYLIMMLGVACHQFLVHGLGGDIRGLRHRGHQPEGKGVNSF